MCLLCNLGTSLLCPLFLLRELSRYLLGKTEKGGRATVFSVLASLSSYRCDLTFACDVISILHFFIIKKRKEKKGYFRENLQDFFSS
jgi:hypothetical protein